MTAAAAEASPPAPAKSLNVALWLIQFLLFAAFAMAGFTHLTGPVAELSKSMPWTGRVPEWLLRFIGGAELAGALGLILPSLSRVKPRLTPLAALGLGAIMLLGAVHHLRHGEPMMVPINLTLGGLAAFVAWGRAGKARILDRQGR
jgi:putative oxidoreductase